MSEPNVINGFPKNLIFNNESNNKSYIANDYVEAQKAKTIEVSTETTVDLITPTTGCKVSVRGVLITTDGNVGEAYIKFKNSGQIILPLYASISNRISPAGRINVTGEVNDIVQIVTTGTVTNKVFFGVSYIEVKE